MDHALQYNKPRNAGLVPVELPDFTESCGLRVRSLWSGISRGTERLVFEGRVPVSEYGRMRAPFQAGDFPFPVIYGYSNVGMVEEGPDEWRGRAVFSLFPHQTRFDLPVDMAVAVPEGLSARRATLAANMETALNALWDSGVGPGDRVGIVGGGVLGGLVAGLCGRIPGCEVTLVDIDQTRGALAGHMGVGFCAPPEAPEGCDVVFHTSASEAGLETAMGAVGFEGTLVELSWYGDVRPSVPLGGAFHSQRLRLISSQVGHVATGRRARWSYHRRLSKALDLLRDDRFEHLITGEVKFSALPDEIGSILGTGSAGLATVVKYQ